MNTIPYNPGMQITNTEQLPKGTGAKYLEVIVPDEGPIVAVAWRKTKPKTLKHVRKLIEFNTSKRKN